ncbi:MAG: WD40/YVTN/BNR-like repeat-containing protein [Mucilaginibacter sp.]
MKKLFYLVPLLAAFFSGCKKDKRNIIDPPAGRYTQVIKGNAQTDTVGNQLKDSIIVKVTSDGSPMAGYILQFKRSGCQDQTITEATTSSSGQASFSWYLSGQTGEQKLSIILLDNNHNKIDSTAAVAIGIAPARGWHRGGCLQNFPVNHVAALSSGRILASVNATNYPYYSDDNALSWHPLTTFPNTHFISKIIPTSAGTFLATQNDGIFLSGDNGQTWTNISSGIWNVQDFSDMNYTAKGNLIVTNSSGLFLSSDNGQSWNEDDFGLPAGSATYPVELPNGNILVIGSDNSVYMLPLHRSTWQNIGASGNYTSANVESLYADDKGNIFIGTPHDAPDGTANIYESVDGGQSWSRVFTQTKLSNLASYPNIDNIGKINGIYYFAYAGIGLYQTSNFVTYDTTTYQLGNIGLLSYTVSKSSTLVIGSPGFGIYYKVP